MSARARLTTLCLLALGAAGLLAWAFQAAQAQSSAQPVIARVTLSTRADVERFVALGLDMLEMREGDDLFVLTTGGEVQQLSAQGWQIRVDNTQTLTLNRPHLDTFMDGYRSVSEMRDYVSGMATTYPTLTQVFTYGLSWQGRELFGIRLTNKNITGTKPTFFLMAAIHARELSTSELALRFIEYLLSRYGVDGDATWLLDEQQVVVVPVANPDGRVLAEQGFYQRKNMNNSNGGDCKVPPTVDDQYGTDLNRNSTFKWGTAGASPNPCDQTYRGPGATSEPESVALQDLIRSYFADQRGPGDTDAAPLTTTGTLITLHSFGNLVLHPWGYTYTVAPNEGALAAIGQKFASYNGYLAEQSIDLYPTSGTTDDWAYGDLGIAAFTFEVGPGDASPCAGFMPPFSCLDADPSGTFWPRNLPAFLYAARIARAPYRLGLGPNVESLTASMSKPNEVQLHAQISSSQAISTAEYYLDTPPWRGGIAHPLALDGLHQSASATLTLDSRHLVYVRAQDVNGNWGPTSALWVAALRAAQWLPLVGR